MSNEVLRFYIATDGTAMQKAEMALVYSIQKVCSVPFSVHFMDKHRPDPLWHGWNDKKWYTPFSNFRFAIPEVNGFQGRAVYMDVDQIILKDPKELFELEIPEDGISPGQACVFYSKDSLGFKVLGGGWISN